MRRKLLSVVLCVCMMMTMVPFAFAAETTEGSKTWTDSVTTQPDGYSINESTKTVSISSAEGLAWFAKQINSTSAKLTGDDVGFKNYTINIDNDINLSGRVWIPIDAETVNLNGKSDRSDCFNNNLLAGAVINGNGHTISNMTIHNTVRGPMAGHENAPGDGQSCYYYSGFIGRVSTDLTIENLNFTNASVDGHNEPLISTQGSSGLGVVVGLHGGGTLTISDVSVTDSSVSGYTKLGGLVGFDTASLTLVRCSVDNCKINLESFTIDGEEAIPSFAGSIVGFKASKYPVTNGIKSNGNVFTLADSFKTYSRTDLSGNPLYYYTDGDWNLIYIDGIYMASYAGGGNSYITIEDKEQKEYGFAQSMVAEVNGWQYSSLENAIAAAKDGETVKLLKDTTVNNQTWISNNVTLDLNNHNVSACAYAFKIRSYGDYTGGSLKVTGTGTIDCNSQNGTFYLIGSDNSDDNKSSKLLIDKDVSIINGAYTFFIDRVPNKNTSYNLTVDIYGDITSDEPVYVTGNIHATEGNVPEINIHNGANFNILGNDEIYLAGYAKTTIENGVTITNPTGNTVTLAAGELVINGGTFNGGNTIGGVEGTGGAIDVSTSSAIYVQQHGTNLPTKVTINGGIFNAAIPLYQEKGKNDKDNEGESSAPELVEIVVKDGKFASNRNIADGGVAVKSDDNRLTIEGGYFTTDPSDYCDEGLTGIPSTEPGYAFTVGTAAKEVKPATAAPNVDASKISDTTDKATAKEVSESVTDTNNVLSAAASDVANSISPEQVTQAKEQLKKDLSISDNSTTIYTYAQAYLKVTPTDVKKSGNTITSITMDIQPMYRVVASTKNKANEIILVSDETAGKTKNAIVLNGSDTKLTNIQTMKISLELPSTFTVNNDNQVYVQHKGHEYIATVTTGENSKQIAIFTNPDGFSTFTISSTSTAVAKIGDNRYTSLQDAVDASNDKDVIEIIGGNSPYSATMSGSSRTITVKNGTAGEIKVTINGTEKTLAAKNGENAGGSAEFTYTRPSHNGSGSTSTTYNVNVNAATNGAVAADKKTASKGTTVTVTASPSKGYVVDAVKVVDKDGKDVAVTGKDGKYVFTMPASAVTVTGSFKAETPAPVALPFSDVKSGNWFYDAVKYAYAQGLMTGTSATTFAPNGTMNRAMIVTVLYRLEKSPAVTGASKFTDVPAGQWYSDAVAWAAANKIVNGYDETTFGPMNAVTREQMAAILFRYEQVKGLENVTLEENLNRFPDQNKISAYAIPALQWAVGQKIINGNANGTLDPTGTATRAQVAQIFTNLLNK